MKTSEIDLIKKAQAGDGAAFGELYDTYIKRIYDFVYYKTMHKQTAEDLTSDVFFKALRKIDTFNVNKGTLQAWLYQIARNTVIDHYRTSKPSDNIDDVWGLSSSEDVETDIDNKVLLEKVQKHLQKFSAEQREIVLLRLWDELSYQEIADIVGKSPDACKVSFSRSLSKLRASDLAMVLLVGTLIVR